MSDVDLCCAVYLLWPVFVLAMMYNLGRSIALVEENKWAGAWMKPTCSFVLCVVDDCRTTLCSNLKWLRKDHNCLLSSINATASSAVQSAEVTKGNNPKCDSNTNLFRVFYSRCGRQLVDLLFDVSCTSFWNEGEIRLVTNNSFLLYSLQSFLHTIFLLLCLLFFYQDLFNHGCSWVANVLVMLAGFCVIDFLGAFGCHGASWRWNPLSSSEPMFLWCWIFVIGGSTLYIVPWIIRTCFGFKGPFGEAFTQVTSTTCWKMHRCRVMSGPVVTLKWRKMWCSICTQVVIPATKDYSYFWKDFKEKYCEGCLPRVYIL
jgi:hypothetical protein